MDTGVIVLRERDEVILEVARTTPGALTEMQAGRR